MILIPMECLGLVLLQVLFVGPVRLIYSTTSSLVVRHHGAARGTGFPSGQIALCTEVLLGPWNCTEEKHGLRPETQAKPANPNQL